MSVSSCLVWSKNGLTGGGSNLAAIRGRITEERCDEVESLVFDLFANLGATEEQLDFPVLYASAKEGWASSTFTKSPPDNTKSMSELLDAIIRHVPPPTASLDAPFQMLVSMMEKDFYLGRILTGRVSSGVIRVGDRVHGLRSTDSGVEKIEEGKVLKLMKKKGTNMVLIDSAGAGDIISMAGLTSPSIGHTVANVELCSLVSAASVSASQLSFNLSGVMTALPTVELDPPTISMTFSVNDSPLAGRDGTHLTGGKIGDRLMAEAETNLAINVLPGLSESYEVQGRGELQLGILIENMRREGFELSVSPPKVMLMIKAEETGITEGFFVGRDRTRVSLLQFADDTIFFSKASMEHLQNLKIILLVFGQVSGLKINLEKSTILGLSLGGNPKTIDFWDPVVERILRRLDGWKKGLFVFGREDYFNSVLFPRERSGLWHKVIVSIYGTHPNGWNANTVVRWSHRCPWKAIAQVFQEFSPFVCLVVGNGERIRFWEDLWWDSRAWSLSSPGLFSVKSFFLALSKVSNPLLFLPAKFLWSSKVPSKVKTLAWLVAHGKVNTNDKLQLRRPYKALCPQWCILCKGNGESIDHIFLHCPVTIGLWHRLFNLVGLVWVPLGSLEDMLVITFKGLGNSLRGKTLWQIACLTSIWMVWQERNNRIFEDKGRTEEMVWDLIWYKTEKGVKFEPLEEVTIEVNEEHVGLVMEALSHRRAEVVDMGPVAGSEGRTRISMTCPSSCVPPTLVVRYAFVITLVYVHGNKGRV
ncbi:GTP-binding protein TypA/BipA-like [Vitis vinifera]|uniref:GTP-binding protein TypA/BipA-like n=1 Tax=Vitis vinifera TaxID=29760 RepID=A0A438JKC9_VITVI|nr:GTP-binding protein TypA/BipA-like [Vitis vinifera]